MSRNTRGTQKQAASHDIGQATTQDTTQCASKNAHKTGCITGHTSAAASQETAGCITNTQAGCIAGYTSASASLRHTSRLHHSYITGHKSSLYFRTHKQAASQKENNKYTSTPLSKETQVALSRETQQAASRDTQAGCTRYTNRLHHKIQTGCIAKHSSKLHHKTHKQAASKHAHKTGCITRHTSAAASQDTQATCITATAQNTKAACISGHTSRLYHKKKSQSTQARLYKKRHK